MVFPITPLRKFPLCLHKLSKYLPLQEKGPNQFRVCVARGFNLVCLSLLSSCFFYCCSSLSHWDTFLGLPTQLLLCSSSLCILILSYCFPISRVQYPKYQLLFPQTSFARLELFLGPSSWISAWATQGPSLEAWFWILASWKALITLGQSLWC